LLLYLLPYFERLHPHLPDRIIVIFHLGAALLAGATLGCLKEKVGSKPSLLALPLMAALFLATSTILFPPEPGGWVDLYPLSLKEGLSIPLGSLLFLVLALVLVVVYVLLQDQALVWRGTAFTLLALFVLADLLTADRATIAGQDFSGAGWVVRIRETDLAAYYSPSGAARFLQSKGEEEPFRYFGYDPWLEEGLHLSSHALFADPAVQALEANGRSALLGLQDVQGYNPTHIARYDQFMSVLNGGEQGYHFIDVYEKGLDSPLLDLLLTSAISLCLLIHLRKIRLVCNGLRLSIRRSTRMTNQRSWRTPKRCRGLGSSTRLAKKKAPKKLCDCLVLRRWTLSKRRFWKTSPRSRSPNPTTPPPIKLR
jgi:hypothetical protein